MASLAPTNWAVDPALAGAREVLPGLWRLRLPLPWVGNEHVNAYAIDGLNGGIVLVDCGTAGHPTTIEALEVALVAAGRRLEDVELLVGTHSHSDHIGLAGAVVDRSGAEFWTHPQTGPLYDGHRDPAGIGAQRLKMAVQEGVPAAYLDGCRDMGEEIDAIVRPLEPDVALQAGMTIPTALGDWELVATPGHSPSQLALALPDRRAIIVADLVCANFAPWFDIGYSPDPMGEWQQSLDRVQALGRFEVALPGHGRPMTAFDDVLNGHRAGLASRCEAVLAAVAEQPNGAWNIATRALPSTDAVHDAVWAFDEALAYLRHLLITGKVKRMVVEGIAVHSLA